MTSRARQKDLAVTMRLRVFISFLSLSLGAEPEYHPFVYIPEFTGFEE